MNEDIYYARQKYDVTKSIFKREWGQCKGNTELEDSSWEMYKGKRT